MAPSRGRSAAERRAAWILVGLMVAVAIPGLAAGIRAAHQGWNPTIDDGFLVTRAYDVFTTRSPAIGQFSMAGEAGATPVHSLGPVPYWLLAVPVRLLPIWSLPVWMAAANGLCLSASVWLARRRAGLGFAWATAAGLLLLSRAIGPVAFAAVWNPWAGLAPLIVLAFLAWSVADGDTWALPAAVAVGSYSMQSHLTYVLPSIALLLVAVAGGFGGRVLRRRPEPPSAPAVDARGGPARSGGRRHLALALGVGAACWVLPLVQQVTHDPGNLRLVADAGRDDRSTAGATAVEASISRVLGWPPSFARPMPDTDDAMVDGLTRGSSTGFLLGVLVVVGLLGLGIAAARRRDRTMAAGVAVAGALVAGMWGVAASMPLDRGLAVPYTFRWFGLAGLFAWLVCGLGVARLAPARWAAPRRADRPAWLVGALALGLVVALAVPLLELGPTASWSYHPAERLGDALVEHTRPGGRYRVARSGPFAVTLVPAMAWRLRSSGRTPVLEGNAADAFGDQYGPTGSPCDGTIVLLGPAGAPDPQDELLATVATTGGPGSPPTARLYLEPPTAEGC